MKSSAACELCAERIKLLVEGMALPPDKSLYWSYSTWVGVAVGVWVRVGVVVRVAVGVEVGVVVGGVPVGV
jgi:hypothetical protein